MKITILSFPHSGVKLLRKLIKLNFKQDMYPDKQHIGAWKNIKTYNRILLVRDVRDVMIGTFLGEKQRALNTNWKEKYIWENMTFPEYLRYKYRKTPIKLMTNLEYWVYYYQEWEKKGYKILIRYEDIVKHQKQIISKIGKILKKKPKFKFINTTQIIGIPTTIKGYHPGISNWKKYFNKEDLDYCNKITKKTMEKYYDL